MERLKLIDKQCPGCHKTFPADKEFWYTRGGKRHKDLWFALCKTCAKARTKHRRRNTTYFKNYNLTHKAQIKSYHHQYYLKQKEKINARNRDYRHSTRLAALNHYSNNDPHCECCNERHLEFLAIDHINGNGNKHRIELNQRNIFLWLKRNAYPSGFRLLCHNCNFALGLYKECPHNNPEFKIQKNHG